MNEKTKSRFGNIFGIKPEPQKSTPVVVTSYSQPHVLQQRMKERHLTHGQTVKANLSPVRLESVFGKMVMYFCPLRDIAITEKITDGDGGILPTEATIIDFNIPANTKPGLYELENATLFSNGTLQVIANENTTFKPYGDPRMVSEVSFSGHITIGEMIDMYYRNKKELSDSVGIPASRF